MKRILVAVSLLAGCAASPPRPQSPQGSERQLEAQTTSRKPGEPVVAASPQALLRKDAVRKVQAALEKKGYASGRSGTLDDTTKEALRQFQRKQNIAATGLPDQLTLRRLNLDPKDILGKNATSKKGELEIEKSRK